MKTILTGDALTLHQIAKQIGHLGEFSVIALLNILVTDAVLFFNVGKSMDADQVKQTVNLIMQEYHYFKPEDFKLCFNKAMKGHYGKLYDRIDGQVILGWLNVYDDDRTQEIEQIRASENKHLKQLEARPLLPAPEQVSDTAAKHIEIWKERLSQNKVAMAKPPPGPDAKRNNAVYQMHQRWFRQFDALYAKQKRNDRSVRYVKRYGRMLDINEFLEYKQLQYQRIIPQNKK